MEVSIQRKVSERMKAFITNKSLTINPKGISPYNVDHLAGYIFAGNGFLVSVPEGDRRFVLFEATGKYIHSSGEGRKFVREWLKWKEDAKNLKAVYDLLINAETNIEYLKHERPVTAYYKKVIRLCPSKMVSHMVHIKIIKKYNSLFRCINPLHLNNEKKK